MKLIFNRAAVKDAADVAESIILKRIIKPVLGCVKMVAEQNGSARRVLIYATDMETALRYVVTQVDVAELGECLLPLGKLREIINRSTDDTMTMESHGDEAKMIGSDANYRILSYPVAEYPPVGFDDAPEVARINAGEFKGTTSKTIFCAAEEATRHGMIGVLLEAKNSSYTMTATDGTRMAVAKGDMIGGGGTGKARPIIPLKCLDVLNKLIGDDEKQAVSVRLQENRVTFDLLSESGDVVASLSSLLVDANFPPYQDHIPKNNDKKFSANRERTISAIRRAMVFSSEESRGVCFDLTKNEAVISAASSENGDSKINLPLEYGGEAVKFGLIAKHLVEALGATKHEVVQFEMTTPTKAVCIKAGPSFLYVAMPVSV